jgi:hypothetical protein
MSTSSRALELRALTGTSINADREALELRALAVLAGSVSLTPVAGTVALTGYAPALLQPQAVTPAAGTVALTGYAPALLQPQAATPAAGTVALTGYAPVLGVALTPATGTVALTGYAPALLQPQAVTPAAGTVALTGYAPVATQSANYFAHPTPEVWLQILLDDIQVSQYRDERLWTRDPESVFCSLQTLDYQARYLAADVATTTKLLECQHVETVQNIYPTTGADDVYITASTVL